MIKKSARKKGKTIQICLDKLVCKVPKTKRGYVRKGPRFFDHLERRGIDRKRKGNSAPVDMVQGGRRSAQQLVPEPEEVYWTGKELRRK